MANKFFTMSGNVVILSGEDVIKQFDPSGISVDIQKSDLFELDPVSGIVTKMSANPVTTMMQFSFDPKITAEFFFTITADLENLAAIDGYIERAISNLDVDSVDVCISVSEIVHNAIKAAVVEGDDHDLIISLLYVPELDILTIGITDDLGRLDVDRISLNFEDDQGNVNIKAYGRGLGIVAALMKVLAISQSNNGEKEVIIIVPMIHSNSGQKNV